MNTDRLPAILDGLNDAVFLIDAGRQILFANSAAQDLFGPSLEGFNFVRAVRHPDCISCIDEVLEGAPSSQVEVLLYRPSAAVYRVHVVGIETAGPDDVRAVISINDISHIREAEQMRSDFVANVSHELRSPLTALSGFIETLKGPASEDPEARARFLHVMAQEADRMDRLIGDLLSLSKVESDARVRPTTTSNVVTILEHVIATLSLQAVNEDKQLILDCQVTDGRLPGDADQLTQVFQNLIENALKYGDAGTDVTVSVRKLDHAAGLRGPALSIAVRDRGAGIAGGHIPRLTERFYRVDEGRSRDKGGTGLGLAIVKHIVGRHRGRLQISSDVGVGSEFTVLLPATMTQG